MHMNPRDQVVPRSDAPDRIVHWLRTRAAWQLVITTVIADFVTRLLILPLSLLAFPASEPWREAPTPQNAADDWLLVLFLLLIAPLLETLIFQIVVQRGLGRIPILGRHPHALVGLSAVLFAARHSYSLLHVMSAFGAGLVFAAMFYFAGAGWRAFWIVAISHFCINGWVTVAGCIRTAFSQSNG
jgi:uncharacterized protein